MVSILEYGYNPTLKLNSVASNRLRDIKRYFDVGRVIVTYIN